MGFGRVKGSFRLSDGLQLISCGFETRFNAFSGVPGGFIGDLRGLRGLSGEFQRVSRGFQKRL